MRSVTSRGKGIDLEEKDGKNGREWMNSREMDFAFSRGVRLLCRPRADPAVEFKMRQQTVRRFCGLPQK